MKRHETTRRSFLGSLAVLAAGAAVSSPVRLFSDPPASTGLQQQWDLFCRQHGGRTYYGSCPHSDEYGLPAVAGHTYKSGKAIYFREAGLLALPVWIYWGTDKPADVCITLFEKATRPENGSQGTDSQRCNIQKINVPEADGQKVDDQKVDDRKVDDRKVDDQQADSQKIDGRETGSLLQAIGPWKKIRRLNNYELQGLNALSAEVNGIELLAALKESAMKPRRSGKLNLTTRIKKDKAQIKAALSQNLVTLDEKLSSYYG